MKNNLQTNQKETQFFPTNDVKIAFDVISGSDITDHRQILFLINGFQRTRHDFRAFRQALITEKKDLITIALDNRFCGETQLMKESTKNNNNINLLDFAHDALALLNHCVEKFQPNSVHILGISMGGMIAQILASLSNCPQIQSLFLVSTTAGGKHRVWPNELLLQQNFTSDSIQSITLEERLKYYFGEKFLKNSYQLFKMFVQNIKKQSEQDQNRQNAQMQEYASKNFAGITDFSALKAKNVVIITGNEDHVMPLKNAENLHKLIPHSHMIIYSGIGHLILIENSKKFVHDVLNYLHSDE